MIIDELQQALEDIYGIRFPARAKDYLINQQTLKILIEKNLIDASFLKKKGALFIYEEDDGVSLSLYLHERLFDGLKKPLSWKNLQKFCTIAEEISHFCHFLWFFEIERKTTQLELELLGEIDKYLLSFLFMTLNRENLIQLRQKIFGDFFPLKEITSQQRQRYYDCYWLASKYCRYLEERFLKKFRINALFTEIRCFHCLSPPEKISVILRC